MFLGNWNTPLCLQPQLWLETLPVVIFLLSWLLNFKMNKLINWSHKFDEYTRLYKVMANKS